MVSKYGVGGVIFFAGTPGKQATLTSYLQGLADVPLLVGIDAEWGLAMRLDSTVRYPYQMPIGAIPDDSASYKLGAELARQCRRLGIHINFAP